MNYNWKNKTILVAEDSEMNFILLKKSLESSGAEIIWAKDGEELMKSVESQKDISIILMDISMPKMDGFTATKALRKAGFSTPIIAQSAFLLDIEKDKIIEAGCNDFIAKP
ncbi:MAG: response regulator, partial [Bacteroidales bacterium]|nr:response regulator [Bacteroidales bacterium]